MIPEKWVLSDIYKENMKVVFKISVFSFSNLPALISYQAFDYNINTNMHNGD